MLARTRKRVAFDRLLARLTVAAPGQWLLKGGFALDLRLAPRARSTKDVDIEWRADVEQLLDVLLDAANHKLDDFFVFAIETAGTPEDHLDGSHRFKVNASLAGRPFEAFALDVGHSEGCVARSDILRTDDLLVFAGIDPVEVNAITLEVQAAEKLHALTRIYEGGRTSTRTKDLVDLALISLLSKLDAAILKLSISGTFTIRATHPVPKAVPPPPPEWGQPFRKLADQVGIPNRLTEGHSIVASLLDPILDGTVTDGVWNPENRGWERPS